nr:hypothetical protein [Paenibacillus larvae]
MTGPLGLTEYWQPAKRLQDALGERILANVLREEAIEVGGRVVPLAYGRRKIAKLNKEVAVDPATGLASKQIAQLHEVQLRQGRLLWCGLPVEMNDREEALHVLYSHVLEQCRVEPELTWHKGGGLAGIYGRKLSFREGACTFSCRNTPITPTLWYKTLQPAGPTSSFWKPSVRLCLLQISLARCSKYTVRTK